MVLRLRHGCLLSNQNLIKQGDLKMKRFYNIAITKVPIGSAIEYKEPALQGKVVIKVSDMTTAGNYKLFVIDCDDAQNKANLVSHGVSELSEDKAVKLAAKYQPKRTVTRFNPRTMKEEKITIPVCDLKKFYQ